FQCQKKLCEPGFGFAFKRLLFAIDLINILQSAGRWRDFYLLERVVLAQIHFKQAAGRDALNFRGFSVELDFAFSVQIKAAVAARPVCRPMLIAIVRLHAHVVELGVGSTNADIAARNSRHSRHGGHRRNTRDCGYSGYCGYCRHTGALEHRRRLGSLRSFREPQELQVSPPFQMVPRARNHSQKKAWKLQSLVIRHGPRVWRNLLLVVRLQEWKPDLVCLEQSWRAYCFAGQAAWRKGGD